MKAPSPVRPLEDDWLPSLEAVARAHGLPSPREVARLGARVAELSAAYNDPARAKASAREAGAARLGFSFARDVPKAGAAVRQWLLAGGPAAPRDLRVLDVGAGLGAATWGIARALQVLRGGAVAATWVDPDAAALALGVALVRERTGPGILAPRVTTLARPAGALEDLPRYDLVVAGALLSELDVGESSAVRVTRHAALLGAWVARRLEPGGAVVVVEPALRERTRHLHRVRDALLASGAATVFAPCFHDAPCPMLAAEGDWCHEDLDVDLPGWLAPVARAAGLRREGLTFSYLVLRPPAAAPVAPSRRALRVVSSAIVTKGKREAFLCGAADDAGELAPARVRAMRLDRDASPSNAAWDDVARGDAVVVDPPLARERPRIGASTRVSLEGDTETG